MSKSHLTGRMLVSRFSSVCTEAKLASNSNEEVRSREVIRPSIVSVSTSYTIFKSIIPRLVDSPIDTRNSDLRRVEPVNLRLQIFTTLGLGSGGGNNEFSCSKSGLCWRSLGDSLKKNKNPKPDIKEVDSKQPVKSEADTFGTEDFHHTEQRRP